MKTTRKTALLFVLAAAVPAALFAQPMSEDGVSRAPDGTILHRRLPSAGGAVEGPSAGAGAPSPSAAAGGATETTPTFVYDPSAASGDLPRDLTHEGRSLPRPATSPEPGVGEPIHTASGLRPPPAPSPEPAGADARPGEPPAPSETLPRPLPSPATPDPTAPPGTAPGPADPSAPTEPAPPGTPPEVAGDPAADPASDPAAAPGDPAAGDPAAATGPGAEPPGDPRGTLGSEARPDRDTEREGTLHYNEVFDPSIVPFKRNRALDEVAADHTLRLGQGRLMRLEPIGNRLDAGREVFWGSLILEGRAGETIPLPSVAAESRILSYEANPAQAVRFDKDEADNFYATPSLDGRVRLVFVMDAPRTYFGRALPSRATLADVPAALRPKVPAAIVKEAHEVARAIGVPDVGERRASYAATLDALVGWFRGFVPGDPPPTQASVYRDVALGQRGVCRHRAHGFVITAQSLGIPARYVFNEAHVFVEVWVPATSEADAGWLRIDLGGGADELQVHNGQGKTLHEPSGPDPFTSPDSFDEARDAGRTAGAERVSGLPREAEAVADAAPAPGEAPGESPGAGVGPGGAGAAEPGAITRVTPVADLVPTTTTLAVTSSLVFRGEGFEVEGRVSTLAGAPVGDGAVQLVLLVGPERRAAARLGTTNLGPDGTFAASVAIPRDQPPGSYELVAEYLGDSVHSPSVSP
ncbi:MAG: hypothetical protein IT385_17255 [Deltaproteobacteria bacterium]|nr:hypothetical protein [Deltaproteobacteria bacterium]